jgi:hypothetical protein
MTDHLVRIPIAVIGVIVSHFDFIQDIENLKSAFPRYNTEINVYLRGFISSIPVEINLMDYHNCVNLIYTNNNVLFVIRDPIQLGYLHLLPKIKNINFVVRNPLKHIYDSLEYLEDFLETMTYARLKRGVYRIIFKVVNLGYAYVFDKGSASLVNLNQLRTDVDIHKSISRADMKREILKRIYEYFPNVEIYTCLYSTTARSNTMVTYVDKEVKYTPIKEDLFDASIRSRVLNNGLILYIKSDDNLEVYHVPSFIENILQHGNFININNSLFEGLRYLNKILLKLILINYGNSNDILEVIDEDDIRLNLWKDALLAKGFPITKNVLETVDNQHLKAVIDELISDGPRLNLIVDIMLNSMLPLDTVPSENLKNVDLPPLISYINRRACHKEILDSGIIDMLSIKLNL